MLSPSLQAKVNILIFSQCFLANQVFARLISEKRERLSQIDGINYSLEACVQAMVSRCKAELREPDDQIITQNDTTTNFYMLA